MKKLFIFALLIVTMFTLTIPALADQYVVTTESDPLNVRTNPQGTIIGSIPKGAIVNALDVVRYDGCNWIKIEYKGCVGYLFGEFMTRTEPCAPDVIVNTEPQKAKTGIDSIGKVPGVTPYNVPELEDQPMELVQVDVKGGLNVRKEPSRRAKIRVCAVNHAYLWLLETKEVGETLWGHVIYEDGITPRKGWVKMEFVIPVDITTLE